MSVDLDDALVAALEDLEFIDAMRGGLDRFADYREKMPLVQHAYTRTLLCATPRYELVAMVWAPTSRSPIHDHGNSHCWVVMLEGNLEVENFERLDDGNGERARLRAAGSSMLARGTLDYRYGPRELHRVTNRDAHPAYSLQLYAAPLSLYTVIIDESSGLCGTASSKYDLRAEI